MQSDDNDYENVKEILESFGKSNHINELTQQGDENALLKITAGKEIAKQMDKKSKDKIIKKYGNIPKKQIMNLSKQTKKMEHNSRLSNFYNAVMLTRLGKLKKVNISRINIDESIKMKLTTNNIKVLKYNEFSIIHIAYSETSKLKCKKSFYDIMDKFTQDNKSIKSDVIFFSYERDVEVEDVEAIME